MKQVISLDQMLENIKVKNENARLTIESAEKTINIINKIVKARESLNLTQRDIAKKCGIQQPALARIESCKVIPKINTLIKIAEAVGVNIQALTSEEKNQIQQYYLISQIACKASCYKTGNGGYLWTQN